MPLSRGHDVSERTAAHWADSARKETPATRRCPKTRQSRTSPVFWARRLEIPQFLHPCWGNPNNRTSIVKRRRKNISSQDFFSNFSFFGRWLCCDQRTPLGCDKRTPLALDRWLGWNSLLKSLTRWMGRGIGNVPARMFPGIPTTRPANNSTVPRDESIVKCEGLAVCSCGRTDNQ